MSEPKQPATTATTMAGAVPIHILDLPEENLRDITAWLPNKAFVRFIGTCRALRQMAMSSTTHDRKQFVGESQRACLRFNVTPFVCARGVFLDDGLPPDHLAQYVRGLRFFSEPWADVANALFGSNPDDPSPSTPLEEAHQHADDASSDDEASSSSINSTSRSTNSTSSSTNSTTASSGSASTSTTSTNIPPSVPQLKYKCLAKLELVQVSGLESFPSIPTLVDLTLQEMQSVTSLPSLPRLRTLFMWGLSLRTLPHLPALTSLTMWSPYTPLAIPEGALPSLERFYFQVYRYPFTVPALPTIKYLKLEVCRDVTIPALPALEKLDLHRHTNAKFVPQDLPNLKEVSFTWCPNSAQLPLLPSVTTLKGDSSMRALESFPNLRHAELNDSLIGKGALSRVPLLETLTLKRRSLCKTLPPLQHLTRLTLWWGDTEKLSDLPALVTLKAEHASLKTISNLPLLTEAELIECHSLQTVSHLPVLEVLAMKGETRLSSISHMQNLKKLSIATAAPKLSLCDLPSLTEVTLKQCAECYGSNVKQVQFTDCPNLKAITEVPPSVNTIYFKGTTRVPAEMPWGNYKVLSE